MSKSKPKKSVKVVSSIQPDSQLTSSPMPFSSTPFTVSPGLPVQPLTVPSSRQIVHGGGAVKIVNQSKGL